MKLKKIIFKNINSFGKKYTTINFQQPGQLIGIIGKNGCGKTTIFDAINFALFGNAFRQINKPDLINRTNGKGLEVEIHFSNFDSEWIIIRGLKPAILEIYQDTEKLDLDAHSYDIQRYIEKNVIGINEELFRQIFMLGMGNFKSFFHMKPKERRVIFEEVVRINVFTNMRKKIKSNENSFDQKANELKITNQSYLREKLRFEQQLAEIRKQSEVIDDTVLVSLQTEVSEKDVEIKEIEAVTSSINIESVESELTTHRDKLTVVNKRYALLEKDFDDLKKLIEFFKANDICPICKQDIDESFKTEELSERKKTIKDVVNEIEELDAQKEALETGIKEFTKTLATYNASVHKAGKLHREKTEIMQTISAINVRRSSAANNEELITLINRQMSEVEKNMTEIEEKYEKLNGMVDINNTMKYILSDEGIKNFIYQRFIPVLNKYVNDNLAQLDMNIKFVLDNNLDESFYYLVGESLKFEGFSNGEKQLLEMAFLLGFQKFLSQIYNFDSDHVFIDELFDSSIDLTNLEKIVNNMKSKVTKKFVIITHNSNIKEIFDKVYVVDKVNNWSIIKEDAV